MAESREVTELRRLERNNYCSGVTNFLRWQIRLRSDSSSAIPNCPKTRVHRIAGTQLSAVRLTPLGKRILVGLIGFFLDMFKEQKSPHPIVIEDVHLCRSGVSVWVSNLTIRDLNPDTKTEAIDNLSTLICQIVGDNLPGDVTHLLGCLEDFKINPNMENAILLHPSLYHPDVTCGFIEHICAVYKVHRENGSQHETNLFRNIAAGIVPRDHCRTTVQALPAHNEWRATWSRTSRYMNPRDWNDISFPIGVLIFMKHALEHHISPQDYPNRAVVPLQTVEDDLFVLFPTFLSKFVTEMISNNLFPEIWNGML